MELSIRQLYRDTETGGVKKVDWFASKADGSFYAQVSGMNNFTPNPNDSNFVPFDNLLESDVKGWLLNDENWAQDVESELDGNIERQKNPPVLHGLPWAEVVEAYQASQESAQ